MATQLPPDEVLLEQTIVARIRDLLLEVPLIAEMVQVYERERFPDSDERDRTLTTVPDPVNAELALTSVIQIGIPTVSEQGYAGECATQLTLTYPITFHLGVKDEWSGTLEYPNSRALAMAIYMRARKKFKDNMDLGYSNCVHKYLQQESTGTADDEETDGFLHAADWSLTVEVTGILV